jgi:GAF domain-containing protein
LEAERQAYGQMTRSGWQALVEARAKTGYLCNAQGVVTPSTEPRPELMEASRQGRMVQPAEDTVAIPIKVRDQSVAAIRFRKPLEAGRWTDEELRLLESLSDQLGLALESSRLYEDTQRRAARERLIGEITTRVRETLDMETVLKTAIQELGDALNLAEVRVRLNSSQSSEQDIPRRQTGGLYG